MGDISDQIRGERSSFRTTLVAVGADEPTTCGSWTTTDLAVHVVSGELAGGLISAGGRLLVGSGVRADRLAGANASALSRLRKRYGFDWALARLDRDPPRIQRSGRIGAVSLLEAWAHHEDVRAAHAVAPRDADLDLRPVLAVLVRYQRRTLADLRARVRSDDRVWFEPPATGDAREVVVVDTNVIDLCRWLTGRAPVDALRARGTPEAIDAVRAARMTI